MALRKETNTDFNSVTVRFYDTALQEKLRNVYLKSNSESKSNFLIELIERSLQNDEAFSKRQAEVIAANKEISKQLAALATRVEVLENTFYTQLNRHSDNLRVLTKLAACMYHTLLAINDGSCLLREEAEKGLWDYLPERLIRIEKS